MLRRQEQVLRARKREALQVRQHFEVKMADLAQAPVKRWIFKGAPWKMMDFERVGLTMEKRWSYGDIT